MASRPQGYGMTAELQAKKNAKYDPQLEQEARDFIQQRTGRQVTGSFHEALKDGVTLCHLANALKPGSVKKINESKMAFKMMENIGNFLEACYALGVAKNDVFQTVDLYENQNMPQVTGGESVRNVRNFTDDQLKAGQNVIGLQMGTNKGASQAGQTAYGAPRKIHHEMR